jgi:hypothetical protein
VAFVLSTIVLGAMFRGPIEHGPRDRLARGLAYAWAHRARTAPTQPPPWPHAELALAVLPSRRRHDGFAPGSSSGSRPEK